MAGSVYELAILLTLKDAASGGLGRVEDRLRATGKTGRATLQTFQDLRSELTKDLSIAGIGVASLLLLRGGIKSAADFETAMTDLRVSVTRLRDDGQADLQALAGDMNRFEKLGMDLGNRLPGTTQNFIEMFAAMRQGGLEATTILEGAGTAVAELAIVSKKIPKELATTFAQFGQQFNLKPQDYVKLADLFAKARAASGADPQELVEATKYFQLRAGQSLKIGGLEGAETTTRLLTMLKRKGLEGSMAGVGLGNLFGDLVLARGPQKEALDNLKKDYAITLDFFNQKGEFAGIDNLFKQMEKLRTLNTRERLERLGKLFDERGVAVANIMIEEGLEGYRKSNQELSKSLGLTEQASQTVQTYNNKMEALLGTIENIKAATFTPMLDTLKPILDTSNEIAGSLQGWAKAHPSITGMATSMYAMAGVSLTLYGGIRAMTTAWRMWRIASSVGVNEAGQLTFLRTLRAETTATSTALGVATTKAGGLRKTLGGIPAQIGVMIALEYTIVKGIELYNELNNYREAQAGERRANQLSMKSLGAVEADYAKRGEKVPADVYRGRASVAIESLNRQGQFRESLEPGSHFFRELGRFFTFQPMNPYAGGAGDFEARHAVPALRERAPELGNTEVMRAFIAELGKFKLPAEQQGLPQLAEMQRKEIANALQMAFPESYQQATLAVTQGLTSLQQPLASLPTSLDKTGSSATRLAGNFDRFSNRLANWSPPSSTTTTTTTGGDSDTGTGVDLLKKFGGLKAEGGRVLKGASYIGGERGIELFTPDSHGYVTSHDKLIQMSRVDKERNSLISHLSSIRSESVRTGSAAGGAGGAVGGVGGVTIVVPGRATEGIVPATVTDRWRSGTTRSDSSSNQVQLINSLRESTQRDSATSQFTDLQEKLLQISRVDKERDSFISQLTSMKSESVRPGPEVAGVTIAVPSLATGGTIARGGLVHVHDRERIVPATVTDRYTETIDRGPSTVLQQFSNLRSEVSRSETERVRLRPEVARAVAAERGGAGATAPISVSITYSPHVEIRGGGADVPQQVRAMLADQSEELRHMVEQEMMSIVEHNLATQLERA